MNSPIPPNARYEPERLPCPVPGCAAGPFASASILNQHFFRSHPSLSQRSRSVLTQSARTGLKPVDREMARATWEMVGRRRR